MTWNESYVLSVADDRQVDNNRLKRAFLQNLAQQYRAKLLDQAAAKSSALRLEQPWITFTFFKLQMRFRANKQGYTRMSTQDHPIDPR